jgi:hypothetical protein
MKRRLPELATVESPAIVFELDKAMRRFSLSQGSFTKPAWGYNESKRGAR